MQNTIIDEVEVEVEVEAEQKHYKHYNTYTKLTIAYHYIFNSVTILYIT
jgi:hypothetical protein